MPSAIRPLSADRNQRILHSARQASIRLLLQTPQRNKRFQVENAGAGLLGLLLLAIFTVVLSGCGSGGYAGAGITSLSSSAVTIDAGQSFQVTASVAGNEPLSWALSGSSCSGATCGTITGGNNTVSTYTAPAGITSQLKVNLTAALTGTSNSKTVSITVNPDPAITGKLPSGTVGIPYNATLLATGGTAPLTWSLVGSLPAGLTFNAKTGTISGTPTSVGTTTFSAQIVDSSDVPYTFKAAETISISTSIASLEINGTPGAGSVGVAYAAQLSANGGAAPYSFSLISGSLPPGLTLSSSGAISGTPTAAGTSSFSAQVKDSSGATASGDFSILINPAGNHGGGLSLSLSVLPGATVGVPYSATIGVNGGTAPYACQQTAGSLPAGLTLSAGCVVSGTPTTVGTSTMTVKATDSSSPAEMVSGPESITVSPASSQTTLTLTPPPPATVGKPYTGTIGVSGGSSPYNCTITSGVLPAGLTLGAGCVITGTPTTPGSTTVTVTATDGSSPVNTGTGPITITINPSALALALTSLPDATVGTPYTATIGVTGGTAPYSCSIVSGTLPAGLNLGAGCIVSGTPTVAGSVTLGVKATDSSSPVETTTGPVSLNVVNAASLTLVAPPNATVGQPYTGAIGVTGGSGPYTCSLAGGSMPAGLALAANCSISGTPTTPGAVNVTVKATDSSSPARTTTGPVTITVLAATNTLSLSSPPNAIVGVPYTGAIGVSGGSSPYSCNLAGGNMPAGLTLGANCSVTGTPATIGATTVTIHATDSAAPTANTVTGPVVITVTAVPALTLTGSLPNAVVNQPYSQTLMAMGGVQPYTYSITAGSLPAGLNLSSSTGTISGTPTQVGATSFTVTVTDTEPKPQTASLPLVLQVIYPIGPNDGELTGPYAFLFQGYDDVVAGVLAYQTATIGSFKADGQGLANNGELDSNHQSSNPAGNTVATNTFLGSYTLGTDNRGFITLTTLNADGTTGATSTYAITAKAPVSPSTSTSQVDMIEFDSNNLQGTRGSGSMYQQTAASFAAGLTGSFAFGLSGDTPCLPACTVGIVAGPAAAVGQFATDGVSALTSGISDANIATTNYAKELLTGNYSAADSNGRLDLSMQTASTPNGVYPTDFAVYMVNSSQLLLMSTDKHSSYVLLAGTAQQQTQIAFDNQSMNNAIIGYENAQVSPGLLGVTLGNVLNLSTATIFRATGNGGGQCDITNVDVAGATGLVNGISGLVGSVAGLNDLLGTYQSTGNSACSVESNGRGQLDYPNPSGLLTGVLKLLGLPTNPPAPREFYLISPNSGYFLETGYAGLGRFEAQTGSPYKVGSLDGTYVYASIPASSLASINTSGILVADGKGNATTTTDLNVGVGTINLLQLGTTGTYTYQLTNGTAGRFTMGTQVLYEIAPGRFVMVDTNPLTTSPSVSLLY